jgi:hypothetical protein
LHEGSEHKKHPKESKKQPCQPAATLFTKKENATLAQQIEILDWHHKNGANQTTTAQHFDPIYPNIQIKQPLVSSWLKDEPKWREQWGQTNREGNRTAK